MIKGLHHIAIICSERNRALKFYGDALGFIIIRDYIRHERGDEVIMLQGYGIVLELFIDVKHPERLTNPESFGLRHLALKVSDIKEIVRSLTEKGFSPEEIRFDSFTGEMMTFVKDPDGLPIELHE